MNADENVEVKLPNSLAALAQLHAVVGQFCRRLAIHPDSESKIDLVLEEVFTNIVRHGYDDSRPHEIIIRLKRDRDHVRIRVEDDGRCFNPLLVPAVDVTAALARRRIGGLGIHLIRSLMDGASYRRIAGRNVLSLSKAVHRQE